MENLKTRIKELAAKAEAVTDDTLARLGSPTERHRRLASFLDKKMGLTARERRALDSYRADSLSVVQAINSKLPITMPSFAHTQLAAKAEAVREFARGDNFRRVTKLVEHLAPGRGSMDVGGFGHWSRVPSFAAERGSEVARGQAGWLKVFRPKVKPTGRTMNIGGKVYYENAGEWPYGSSTGLGLSKRHAELFTPEKRGF